jgi:putative MATE family efflux protein
LAEQPVVFNLLKFQISLASFMKDNFSPVGNLIPRGNVPHERQARHRPHPGSIPRILIRLATPVIVGMVLFTLYLMVDFYFVGRLGLDAVAAVSISGNAFFVILGLAFFLGTGGMALMARAVGKKDLAEAGIVFRQTLLMTLLTGVVVSALGFVIAAPYIRFFGGVGPSLKWGVQYFRIFSVSFFFILLLQVLMSCFRGMGNTKTPMFINLQSVLMNIVLDPILIFGLLGAPKMGVQGAALASLISQVYSLALYGYLIFVKNVPMNIRGEWRLKPAVMKRSLAIGMPSGVTYFLLAFNMLITYRVLGPFGTAALASVGIGFRILQSIYLPVVALTSAMAAMVAQNVGARRPNRVHRTLWTGWIISSGNMILGTLLCLLFPAFLVGIFNDDPQVIAYGTQYLTIMGLGTVVVGTIMSVSAVFQGIGKTYPTLLAALLYNGLFAAMVFTLPGIFGWGINVVWWIKPTTGILEMCFCALWLRWKLRRGGLKRSSN